MDIRETISLLKARGYRITPQRLTVLKILQASKNHPGAEDIFRKATKLYPKISMTTI